MFTHDAAVRLYHTDAAGRLFFGHAFFLAHDAFEGFAERAGLGVARLLATSAYLLPVVHAEADYTRPIGVDGNVKVRLACERIGESSFTLLYAIAGSDGAECCRVRIVHAAIDKKTGATMPLPAEVRAALEELAH
jgi:acyl-CoA thioesterase FadM